MIFNTDHTGIVVSLGRNSGGVLIVHRVVQSRAASAGHRVKLMATKRKK